jgi:hypothetical protein
MAAGMAFDFSQLTAALHSVPQAAPPAPAPVSARPASSPPPAPAPASGMAFDFSSIQAFAAAHPDPNAAADAAASSDFYKYGIKNWSVGPLGFFGYVPGDPFDNSQAASKTAGDDGTYWRNADGTWTGVSHGSHQVVTVPADDGTAKDGFGHPWTAGYAAFSPPPKTGLPGAYMVAASAKWQSDWVNTVQQVSSVGINAVVPGGLGGLLSNALPKQPAATQSGSGPLTQGSPAPAPASPSRRRILYAVGGILGAAGFGLTLAWLLSKKG